MQITCASCKTTYNLTSEQLQGLSYSILPCNTCNKFIKITNCPHCNSFYSITFSSAQQTRYRLTCERCAKPFVIDFPVIKDAKNAGDPLKIDKPKEKKISFFTKIFTTTKKRTPIKPASSQPENISNYKSQTRVQLDQTMSFTLGNLFSICGTAFTLPKLAAASAAIILSFLILLGGNWLVSLILTSGDLAGNEYIKSFLNIVPFAIIFFLYIMAAAVISRMTMDSMLSIPGFSPQRIIHYLFKAIMPVLLANIIIFIIIDLIFILFGKIPVIGPVLFAILFLPIYITSLCAVILLAIGFWFYPPIIAGSLPEGSSPLIGLFRFIRQQNFSLAYTIPLMTIITAVIFAAIYLLHFGSFTLSMFLSKIVLTDDGMKVFSSIPNSLLQLSDLTIMGSDSGLYKSLMSNLLMTHTVGGFIMGIIFSFISILLFSSFVSITATLSTHLYVMMEQGTDMDDSSKIRLLAMLVLILFGVFLVKKIFL